MYEKDRLREVRFPLGGIGAGNISIDGGARLVDWEIKNRPNKESYNGFSHIAVKAEKDGKVLGARVLNGPYPGGRMGKGLHSFGGYTYGPARETMVGVPHFADVVLEGKFPIARYTFTGDFPGKVTLTAWSPFEPMNDFDSSLPLALFEVEFENTTGEDLDYTAAFTLCNPDHQKPVNSLLKKGILCDSGETNRRSAQWGQACVITDAASVSLQQNWYRGSWFDSLNIFWKDFIESGAIKERSFKNSAEEGNVVFEAVDHGTLCAHLSAPAGKTVRTRFALSWYFPNYEKYWDDENNSSPKPIIRNWYATQFTGAEAVAEYGMQNWNRLYSAARNFVDALYGSSLPEEVIDAAGSTLAVLKSPTCVRLTDGSFYGWEGSHACEGSCEGSCEHVWNYQYALPMLFPALERSMRELDYKYNMNPNGGMSFRLQLPLGSPTWDFRPCADGQMGGIVKSYREWKQSGDTDWLRRLWPEIKRSLEFAWSSENPDRWDPEQSGVLTGRQHHTLDMELFGPNSWLTGVYLAALEAAARMADALSEPEFAEKCRQIRQKGCSYVNEKLWNGEYFFQEIDLNDKKILDRFCTGPKDNIYDSYWNDEAEELKYQIGEGCSIDQLYGQWHADLLGLGDIFDQKKVHTALESVYKYNFIADMKDFFNPCRIYCMENEGGLLICGYPEGKKRPAISAPYAEETMHGFEYAAASHMIRRGLEKEGLTCVRALRDRYDGTRRNPWNEIECGGNYARSMAAWALVLIYQGFSVDMTKGELGFSPIHPDSYQSLWSACSAWGKITFTPNGAALTVLGGELALNRLLLPGKKASADLNGKAVPFAEEGNAAVFADAVHLHKDDVLNVTFA